MHLPKTLISFLTHGFLFTVFCSLFFVFATPSAHAQYDTNTNPDVPQNQHTKAQVTLIENSAALICQLAGIDIMHPDKGCLGVDTVTQKIGYAPKSADSPHVGGLLGLSATMMGAMYTPPASGISYLAGLSEDFGIVKKSYAQNHGPGENAADGTNLSGFDALQPVQKLWETGRNLTYLLLVVIFILLGMGIMLRVKIDPRTAMTIQNQVPRIIIAILLITFSYAIVGFMIDLMWLTTYVGINALTTVSGTEATICSNAAEPQLSLKEGAYANLLNYPLVYMNDLFKHEGSGLSGDGCQLGITYLTNSVADVVGDILNQLVLDIFAPNGGNEQCAFTNPASWAGCILGGVLGWVGKIFGFLVAFIAIIIVMFRLWFQLLKAYAYVIIYTILGPFWIVLGLLPGASLSFTAWIRTLTAKLLAFPCAAFFIIIARVILEQYNAPNGNPQIQFVPPLVGNPNMAAFGPLIAFGILLISPEVLNMLNDALKAPASKYAAPAIMKGIGGGIAPMATGTGLAMGMLMRKKNTATGESEGVLRAWLRGNPNKYYDAAEAKPVSRFARARAATFGRMMGHGAEHN